MVTKGHRHAGKKSKAEKLAEMDREDLVDIRAEIERIALKMQQNARIEKLELWMQQDKKMIYVCEPETRRGLDDFENELGSAEDLKNCQESRKEIPVFQVEKGLRSLRDLRDCHEDSQGISHCHMGNELRSLQDLTDCQEGSGSISYCQVGRDENSRLSESLVD
jgi:hypothetical protein